MDNDSKKTDEKNKMLTEQTKEIEHLMKET